MRFRLPLLFAALLPALATAEPAQVLNVYTHPSFAAEWGPGPAVEQAFEEQCDCALNYTVLESGGDILQRLRLEGSSTSADVVLGLDTATMEAARQTGLLAPHTPNGSNSVARYWRLPRAGVTGIFHCS